jgi:hypothetical protein
MRKKNNKSKTTELIIFFIILATSIMTFAQDVPEEVNKLATSLGLAYVGMPKESLYQIFHELQQKGYRKDGSDEWITFSDWTTEEKGDRITFYLVNGKVKEWERHEKPKEISQTEL